MRAMWATALAVATAGCGRRHGSDAIDAAVATATRDASIGVTAIPGRGASSDTFAPHASASATTEPDGGAPACKVLDGPTAQPFVGPAVLRVVPNAGADVIEIVYNDGGSPRVFADAAPRGPKPEKSTIPACAATGDVIYCPDATGAVRRWGRGAENGVVVARGRAGTDIVAASLGNNALVAYLAERVTSEGLVREAWVAMENAPPVRISEDGSGATSIDLATRGEELIALTIDARVAMTPTHARILTLEADKLRLGNDAVIFVGGGAERHTGGALTTAKDGSTFALVAVAEDVRRFGLAAIKVDDPPLVDARAVWSFYPNGLDPAPVAATRGELAMYVARVRPKTPEADAPHVLEIGMVESSGAFRASCVVTTASFVKDVELARDGQGMLWVFYRTPSGSYLAGVRST